MDPIGANPSQPKPPSLLTARQVAELLQWNRYTVIKKAEKGDLPGFKMGREWRFRQEDIVAWIETKRNGAKR
jgi:excisionase family DNA binding protein